MKPSQLLSTALMIGVFLGSITAKAGAPGFDSYGNVTPSCQAKIAQIMIASQLTPAAEADIYADSDQRIIHIDFVPKESGKFSEYTIAASVCSNQPTGREKLSLDIEESLLQLRNAIH
jgi:hypothetical protein